MRYTVKEVDVTQIRSGDVIICRDGIMRTVCPKDITYSTFMGRSLFGDCYNLGYAKVKKCIIENGRN